MCFIPHAIVKEVVIVPGVRSGKSVQRNSAQRNSGGFLRNFRGEEWEECPAEFRTKEFRRNFTEFSYSAGIKLRTSVIFRGTLLNAEFHKIITPPELFFNGIMDTLEECCIKNYPFFDATYHNVCTLLLSNLSC